MSKAEFDAAKQRMLEGKATEADIDAFCGIHDRRQREAIGRAVRLSEQDTIDRICRALGIPLEEV